jgi:hypothetical protein
VEVGGRAEISVPDGSKSIAGKVTVVSRSQSTDSKQDQQVKSADFGKVRQNPQPRRNRKLERDRKDKRQDD